LELPNGSIVHVEPADMDYKHYGSSKKTRRMEDEVDCEHGQVGSGVEVAGAAINTAAIVEQEDAAEDLDDFFASLE